MINEMIVLTHRSGILWNQILHSHHEAGKSKDQSDAVAHSLSRRSRQQIDQAHENVEQDKWYYQRAQDPHIFPTQ